MPTAATIRHYPTIDSTNLEATRLVQSGEVGPLWLLADEQTGGKGRLGRKWQSPKGNLYSTLLWPVEAPYQAISQIGFVVALAVHDVASAVETTSAIHLKWPNDCLVNGGKVAGVLSETVSVTPLVVAIGCGINLASKPENVPYPTARLQNAGVTSTFAAYREALAARLAQWDEGVGFPSVSRDWQDRAIGIGETIRIATSTAIHRGIFTGLADDGAMLIELATGPQRFYAGDVTIPSLEKLRNKPA